ncbi:hypothetical protein HQN90_09655 [Paenibacillus alba]|nr:hypothetical protein [Paenibacillus alba]
MGWEDRVTEVLYPETFLPAVKTYTGESPIQVGEDVAKLLIGKGAEKILAETSLS